MEQERRRRFAEMSRRLAFLDDAELRALVAGGSPAQRRAWGVSQSAEVEGTPVFVKRIPLTELEQRHPHSTKNHFRLPPHYSYGVGSAGFGAFRELATHVKTTSWVVEGAHGAFPLLYHHRVMSRRAGQVPFDLERYRRYWGGSKRIVSFIEARAAADAEIWLVLEHVPHVVGQWLLEHQSEVEATVEQVCATAALLRDQDVVHFDAHAWNIVSDGSTSHLTDFGLTLDGEFSLGEPEREFLAAHRHYDSAEAAWSLTAGLLFSFFEALDDSARAAVTSKYAADGASAMELVSSLFRAIDRVQHDGDLPLDDGYVRAAMRYRDVSLYFHDFYARLSADPRKRVRWDDAGAVPLLDAAGIPTG